MRKNRFAASVCAVAMTAALLPVSPLEGNAANYNRVAVHDPSIIKLEDDSYFIIGSHLGAARCTELGNWSVAANSDQCKLRSFRQPVGTGYRIQ